MARYRGESAGMALFFRSFSTFKTLPGLYLEDLFVRPHLRGRGIGRALMIHLARLARERGYARFEWSVLDWNEPASRFYRALGAEPLDGLDHVAPERRRATGAVGARAGCEPNESRARSPSAPGASSGSQ